MSQGEQRDPTPIDRTPRPRRRYRSLFWAIVLIAVGVVWLLANVDVISQDNLAMLALLWPILLVGIGVDLLVGRRSPAAGAVVGVVTVGLIIVFMLLGPTFGWTGDTELKTETFSTPAGEATSARVTLDLSRYSADVYALDPSTSPDRPLLVATATYRGSVDLQSSGDAEKTVVLESKSSWWRSLGSVGDTPWDIGLDPGIPLDLSVRTSSGSGSLDLSQLEITGLQVDASSGSTRVILPVSTGASYPVALEASSGRMEVEAPDGAQVDMTIDMSSGETRVTLGNDSDISVRFNGSSGGFTLDLPATQEFRVDVQGISSGDVKLPSGLTQVAEGDGDEGTWETPGYSAAAHKVEVVVEDMSSGNVTIRQGN